MPTSPYLDRLTHDYIDLVYSSALRRLHNDTHRAADITQAVMLVMLRKAKEGKLPQEKFMAGWLVKVTGYAVMQQTRSAARRARHESAARTNAPQSSNNHLNDDIRAALDDSLLKLGPIDREVLIRRHLQGQSLAQIGAAIGMSENTVGKRVHRALLKLRTLLLRRGITAPAAAIATLLAAELAIKAPASAALTSTIAAPIAELSKSLSWKLAMIKLKIAALLTFAIVLLTGTTTAILIAQIPPPSTPAAPMSWPTTQPTINIARVIDGPNDAILNELLTGLKENQSKLRLIHVHATVITRLYDENKKTWIDPGLTEGEAWLEAGPKRRFRADITHEVIHAWNNGNFGPAEQSSYLETWNGSLLQKEYRPPFSKPGAETFDWQPSYTLSGSDFSMQLPWDQETASAIGKGSWKTIDRNPLDPATLAQMKLSARRVLLAPNQPAMELTVHIPDPQIDRTEVFWFDPARGYGLLARHNTQFLQGHPVLDQTYLIESMTQAAPGIFYLTHAQLYWESNRTPIVCEIFTATQAIANEPIDPSTFILTFPPNIPIYDFKNGHGTQRKPTTK